MGNIGRLAIPNSAPFLSSLFQDTKNSPLAKYLSDSQLVDDQGNLVLQCFYNRSGSSVIGRMAQIADTHPIGIHEVWSNSKEALEKKAQVLELIKGFCNELLQTAKTGHKTVLPGKVSREMLKDTLAFTEAECQLLLEEGKDDYGRETLRVLLTDANWKEIRERVFKDVRYESFSSLGYKGAVGNTERGSTTICTNPEEEARAELIFKRMRDLVKNPFTFLQNVESYKFTAEEVRQVRAGILNKRVIPNPLVPWRKKNGDQLPPEITEAIAVEIDFVMQSLEDQLNQVNRALAPLDQISDF